MLLGVFYNTYNGLRHCKVRLASKAYIVSPNYANSELTLRGKDDQLDIKKLTLRG